MQILFKQEDLKKLTACMHYRQFLFELLEIKKNNGKGISYADLSRRLAVKSRSYPRDIILGKKKITAKLVPRFIKIFSLKGDLKSFFENLVELNEVSCRLSDRSESEIKKSIEKIRQRISIEETIGVPQEKLFSIGEIPKIYAALGTIDSGADLLDVMKRTGYDEHKVLSTIQKMIEFKLVSKKGRRFFVNQMHFSVKDLKASEIFKQHYIEASNESIWEAKKSMNTEDKLFFSAAFSVDKKQLPKLKSDLRNILVKYIDQNEEPSGNKVISLVCSMF